MSPIKAFLCEISQSSILGFHSWTTLCTSGIWRLNKSIIDTYVLAQEVLVCIKMINHESIMSYLFYFSGFLVWKLKDLQRIQSSSISNCLDQRELSNSVFWLKTYFLRPLRPYDKKKNLYPISFLLSTLKMNNCQRV